MQFASLNTALAFLIAIGIAIAFGFAWGGPILAIPIFLAVFIGFLVWRGSRRQERLGERFHERGVPSTEEAASDQARDSGVRDVQRAASPSAPRGEGPQQTRA